MGINQFHLRRKIWDSMYDNFYLGYDISRNHKNLIRYGLGLLEKAKYSLEWVISEKSV